MNSISILRALACILALCAALPAQAQTRRTPNEIVVTRRSYFDAGTLVRPGSQGSLNYVYASTTWRQPDYSNIATRYGAETLPQRFELPNCCGVTVDIPAGPFGKGGAFGGRD